LGETRAFRTLAAAEDWLAGQSDSIGRPNATVDQLLDRWKAGKAALSERGREAVNHAALVVSVRWGSMAAVDVARQDIQEWVASLTVQRRHKGAEPTTEPASASLRHKALQALSGALNVGVELQAIESNPALGVKVPKQVLRDQVILSAGQLQTLATKAGHYRPLILTLGTTGLRIGEALQLTPDDVDRTRRRIRVAAAATKSRRFREVPVPKSVLELLPASGERVFLSERGAPILIDNFRARVWRTIAPEGLRIHDLRHTAASLAIASGADVKAVQRMLGHASAAMTLDRYGHLWDQGLDDVAARMDKML